MSNGNEKVARRDCEHCWGVGEIDGQECPHCVEDAPPPPERNRKTCFCLRCKAELAPGQGLVARREDDDGRSPRTGAFCADKAACDGRMPVPITERLYDVD